MKVFTTTAITLGDSSKKSGSEFRWTNDELELSKYSAYFKGQKEYQGIYWEYTRNKFEKITNFQRLI